MTCEKNELEQPIGPAIPDWRPPTPPSREAMTGRFCRLEALDPAAHARSIFEANELDREGRMWTYLPYGPFESFEGYQEWMTAAAAVDDPLLYAIVDLATGRPVGIAGYLRIDPRNGSIEVGHLSYSPLLQRKPAATEAMFLMMERAFGLGYRRYEWKCHAFNEPSRQAALRLGFTYEGTFRQATVVKGRSRDTAWFSILDREWPALRGAFTRWLEPENFDEQGRQRCRLSDLTAAALRSVQAT